MNPVVSSPAPAGAFNPKQVAEMLSVSKRTIERQIVAGRLKVVRIGRCVRIRADDLAAYTSGLNSSKL
jgi:excisionase family DNA binding protein